MKPKRTSAADVVPARVVILTLDTHLASAVERAQHTLLREIPGLRLALHAATEWADDAAALQRCLADIAQADVIVATMLFMEEHIAPVLASLRARRDSCDAFVACMSAPEIVRLTRLGRFEMGASEYGAIAWLKRLRGGDKPAAAGARQLRLLRKLPKILRFIPGTAQDLRAYFLTLQYWLAGSDDNVANLVRFLLGRYASGPRAPLRALRAQPPRVYPDVGVYHPRLKGRIGHDAAALPVPAQPVRGAVGLLVLRAYVLAGNTRHYDEVIAALEARGLRVIPAFTAGLDARPAIERFFMREGRATVDALLSLTGFSLVGGPAYNDAQAAQDILARLDVPYLAAHPVEFQTLAQWEASAQGLLPLEATFMVAIPELDGATAPTVFGGRAAPGARDMQAHAERVQALVARIDKLVQLRRTPRPQRRIAIVLFAFPPNAGAVGSAAFLSVFKSLFNTLHTLADAGYTVERPASVDALRQRICEGNAGRYGAAANVHARIAVDDHVRRERWLAEIERQWGRAPGRQQSDGAAIQVLGARFGNVFVGVQPAPGYEGDPMRLLFAHGCAPTHAFSAFYRYLREDFGAHAVLHFGTHGTLEFLPGKQVGLSAHCWPERLLGPLPNVYLYACNNPSEGALAKRRAAATLISYLTPPLAQAGLYKGLLELKSSIDRWRGLPPSEHREHVKLAELIQAQAAALDLAPTEPPWGAGASAAIEALFARLIDFEQTLIPTGLHVVGEPPAPAERIEMLAALAEASGVGRPAPEILACLAHGEVPAGVPDPQRESFEALAKAGRLLAQDHELPALLHALDGGYVRPAPGGDVVRNAEVLPTGRNLHSFDPFRIPSAWALQEGSRQAERLLARYRADRRSLPETVALVLWGSDNLKSEGASLAQALALLGARPRFDAYGRLSGAELIPLAQLGRPRIDVVLTLSGIFRDLLPLQIKLLAQAAYLAAAADEAEDANFVRKHALAYQRAHGGDLETAALRVFSNADGAYGANVNHLIDSGRWQHEDELAEVYTRRKCFAYGCGGRPSQQPQLLQAMLAEVALTYQNIDSVELGVTSLDQYVDTLGGISRAVRRARGTDVPVYVADVTERGTVRTLAEQVALEARTRMLNPKWYEGLLAHGYEGVRQIEAHVTNTVGWSATTGQVAPWVYKQLSATFVLDRAMRERLAQLNPAASARVVQRLLEAHERRYWTPDADTLEALRAASADLEDRLEGVAPARMAA